MKSRKISDSPIIFYFMISYTHGLFLKKFKIARKLIVGNKPHKDLGNKKQY